MFDAAPKEFVPKPPAPTKLSYAEKSVLLTANSAASSNAETIPRDPDDELAAFICTLFHRILLEDL
jgi:hypothetical protein